MRFALRAGALGFALALLAAGLPVAVEGRPGPPGSELPPPATGGITKLDPLLQKLTNNRRLLIVGAHPDDENSALLAVVSRKLGGEAAYLSLTRGEGGQNLIGDELGVGLGLIRTQELLAARRLDGARQFFTRAYDFGFSKSLDEALRFWPKRDLLEDAVRVVRRFRPQVVFVTFTGTPADGHGQHSASAVVAREAYAAAGNPGAFPERSREGLHGNVVAHQHAIESDVTANHLLHHCDGSRGRRDGVDGAKHNMCGHPQGKFRERPKSRKIA